MRYSTHYLSHRDPIDQNLARSGRDARESQDPLAAPSLLQPRESSSLPPVLLQPIFPLLIRQVTRALCEPRLP